jgi:hypothetical protein
VVLQQINFAVERNEYFATHDADVRINLIKILLINLMNKKNDGMNIVTEMTKILKTTLK